MPNALAGLASILWGCSDFFGGIAAKSWDVRRVGALAQSMGLVVVVGILLFVPADPGASDLVWGAVAGVATATGVAMLYQSLAIGPMHIAAPTIAVVGATANALFGLIGGERPSATALIGVPLALVSLFLVSSPPVGDGGPQRVSRVVLLLAVGAGLSLGISNACFAATAPGSGLWPVGMSRLVATIILGAAALTSAGGSPGASAPGVRFAAAAGLADIAATISIALALQRGPQVLVGVLGALFPVVTVLLARVVLHELMSRRQFIGLGCAVAVVVVMASA